MIGQFKKAYLHKLISQTRENSKLFNITSKDFSFFKGNAQFMFLCNPHKSGALQVCITFLQITQKILTKDIFHWLELISKILSFLQIFSVRKTTILLFKYFKNSARISTKKTRFLAYFGPLKANSR